MLLKRKKWLGLLLSLIILLSIAFHQFHKTSSDQWVDVKRGPIISAVYGLGTVTSDRVYHLKVGITTSVKKLYVREGDQVVAGQPLVQFSDLPLVKANFNGTITSLPLYENETVYPQTDVLTLLDLNDLYITVSLEQEAAIKIHRGQAVKVAFSGMDLSFNGVVASVYPRSQEFYIKILVDKLPKEILPDMSSDVAIIVDKKADALIIPVNSINDSVVVVMHQGKKVSEKISIGAVDENYAEVLSNNLSVKDKVLVKAS